MYKLEAVVGRDECNSSAADTDISGSLDLILEQD